ncbi:MAG: hypothetical protein IK134_01745 [Oscillospiraceae bacterium]|nr:hypothetical protein [Oscillospiraceae bacterium]MBQ9906667.1 hypothetical protein [Oscillospiraceae bacterium]MBR5362036.1 hypothetical protein [Oscillospiraceae bacterium]
MNELPNAERISAVPVRLDRVFDSCSDKDCITNLQVMLENGAELPPQYTSVKTRCVSIDDICMSVEPIPFNRGYYTVDITYTFGVELLCYARNCEAPAVLRGMASASKSVILYGSESSTKTFFSTGARIGDTDRCCDTVNLPTACCQCVDPIALETRISVLPPVIPPDGAPPVPRRAVVLTLGVFSVVELTRPVTMSAAAYPYQVPTKTCSGDTDSPCEVFSRLNFPTEEFVPTADGFAAQQSAEALRYEGFTGYQPPAQ